MKGSVVSKLPFILLLLAVVVIAAATFVESAYGTTFAHQTMYGAWWFVALWGLIAIAGCRVMYKKKLWKRPSLFVLHLSFLLILAGALTTHISSRSGMTHLREGEATCTFWMKNEQGAYIKPATLPFYLALHDFRILYDADNITPADYVSQVIISTPDGQQETTISMNKIGRVKGFRIYQTSYDDDEQGSVFTISYDPWGTAITYAGYLLMAFGMIWVSIKKRETSEQREQSDACIDRSTTKEALVPRSGLKNAESRERKTDRSNEWMPTLLLTICGTAMASYMVIAISRSPLVPILRSPFLFVHVGTIMLGYILLVVSIVRREVLRPAVCLLAIGIFLGAVWANVSWGTYWSWDPKESWALITLIIYSLPLHQKSLPWFRSTRNYRIYSILGMLSLLMTYFGVNLLGGMHSYG